MNSRSNLISKNQMKYLNFQQNVNRLINFNLYVRKFLTVESDKAFWTMFVEESKQPKWIISQSSHLRISTAESDEILSIWMPKTIWIWSLENHSMRVWWKILILIFKNFNNRVCRNIFNLDIKRNQPSLMKHFEYGLLKNPMNKVWWIFLCLIFKNLNCQVW